MAMVMPRSRSSGALSIVSKARYSEAPFRWRYLVIAAVRVVLPWSMWPIVPMFTCGLLRSNFCLLMSLLLLAAYAGHDLAADARRDFLVRIEMHGVGSPPLRLRTQVGRVPEHLCQRNVH